MNFKSLIKYLVFICYLLPCTFFKVSCDSGFDIYENKQEAEKSIVTQPATDIAEERDTALSETISASDTAVQPDIAIDTAAIENESSINDFLVPLGSFAMFPTGDSMSAFGNMIFPERPLNKLTIAVSLLCSVLSVLPFKLLKRRRISIMVAAINLLSVIAFMAICAMHQITLLWGAWVLLAVVALHLMLLLSNSQAKRNQPNIKN